MNVAELQSYCLQKKSAIMEFPFDDVTMVIKVGNKMFILISTDKDPITINLKCDPFLADSLRASYQAITPGYHMNKRHWNTVLMDKSIPDKMIKEMIDDSYDLVYAKLSMKEKENIQQGRKLV